MSHTIPGPTLDGVLASRLLNFLASKRPSALEKLGDRRLDMARDLAQKNSDRISPSDLKIARDSVLRCSPSPKAYSSHVLTLVSAAEFLQAREYREQAKEALRFVKVIIVLIAQETEFLIIS